MPSTLTRKLTDLPRDNLTRALTDAGGGGGGGSSLVSVPAGFGWTPPVNVYRSSGGVYSTDYDPTPFLTEGGSGVTTIYVDSATGSDANPGTSALPKASLTAATGGRVAKLLIKARGTFYQAQTSNIQTAHDQLCVEAWGGAACILTTEPSAAYPLVWTDTGGGVWSAPPPYGLYNSVNVYLGTDPETMVRLTPAANLAACQATPGTFCVDSSTGTKVFIHTADGLTPLGSHTVYGRGGSSYAYNAAAVGYDQRIAYHGLDFRGGDAAMLLSGVSAFSKRVDFVGCKFRHSGNFAAFHSTGNTPIIHYGCIAGPSVFDGFSCTTASGSDDATPVPKMIEINCIGRNNGWVSGANQGSTNHYGGKSLRVNGQYYNNANDQIADVGTSTGSWNLGCAFGPGRTVGFAGVQSGNNANATSIWLDGCTFSSVTYDVAAASPSTIKYKNMAAPNANPTGPSGGGSVTTY